MDRCNLSNSLIRKPLVDFSWRQAASKSNNKSSHVTMELCFPEAKRWMSKGKMMKMNWQSEPPVAQPRGIYCLEPKSPKSLWICKLDMYNDDNLKCTSIINWKEKTNTPSFLIWKPCNCQSKCSNTSETPITFIYSMSISHIIALNAKATTFIRPQQKVLTLLAPLCSES